MRLDEWQKWLDSQFVEPTPANEPAPAVEPAVPPQAPPSPGPASSPAVADARTESAAPSLAEADGRAESAAPAPAAGGPTVSGPIADMPAPSDLQVPSIESYLPFLRAREVADAANGNRAAEAGADGRESPVSAGDAVSGAVTNGVHGDGDSGRSATLPPSVAENAGDAADAAAASQSVSEPTDVDPGAAAPSVQPPLAEVEQDDPLSEHTEPAHTEPAAKTGGSAAPAPAVPVERVAARRRGGVSHRRARHARNVRPSDVVEEIDPVVMWGLVPKHIQTLIAMESDEVAQNSYRRRFKETRFDLISRLLDPTLSLEDAARLLNVCPTTVRRYTNKGLLTHQRTTGDQRRFKLSDVLAFLEAQSRAQDK